jgi:hypothetical protein
VTGDLAATYVSVADRSYFIGLVALVNSLSVTGNPGAVVVIDAGLADEQRRLLATCCDVRPVPVSRPGTIPLYFKPTVAMLGLHGIVTLIDSDMIVTGSLSPLLEATAAGSLTAFPDTSCIDRHFPEWENLLTLAAAPRARPYVNTGFVAFDADVWAPVLERWWELCDEARLRRSRVAWGVEDPALAARDPFLWGDQDVLNALLMSEVATERVAVLDPAHVGVTEWPDEARAVVEDRRTLRTSEDGRPLALIHYWDFPKPWMPGAWKQLRSPAYADLMARLLSADDVPVRLPASSVPRWLRDDLVGRVARQGPRRARRAVEALRRRR